METINKQAYKHILRGALDPNLDRNAVFLCLIEEFPMTFLDILNVLERGDQEDPDYLGIVKSINNDKMVEAVKALRHKDALGLKEALDVIVAVKYGMAGQGYATEPNREYPSSIVQDPILARLVDKLKATAYRAIDRRVLFRVRPDHMDYEQGQDIPF